MMQWRHTTALVALCTGWLDPRRSRPVHKFSLAHDPDISLALRDMAARMHLRAGLQHASIAGYCSARPALSRDPCTSYKLTHIVCTSLCTDARFYSGLLRLLALLSSPVPLAELVVLGLDHDRDRGSAVYRDLLFNAPHLIGISVLPTCSAAHSLLVSLLQ